MHRLNFLLFFFLSLFLTACESKSDSVKKEATPIPVLVVTPTVKNVPIYFESIGTLQPITLMEIKPRADGPISDVFIHEGEWVKEGDPLFKIDSRPYGIKVHKAKAQLAIDQATLGGLEKKRARIQNLVDKDLIAKSDWDQLHMEILKAEAATQLSQASLEVALMDLEHCTLCAPFAGRVGKLDVHPGLIVSSNQSSALTTLSKMDPLIIEFSITEKEYLKLSQQKVAIEIQSLCALNEIQTGSITFFDNQFNAKTGLLLVRGTLSNPDCNIRPGQAVRVRVPVSEVENAKLIPQKAVKYNQEGPYIYVVQSDNTVGLRRVLLGSEQGNDVIILEGIDLAEPVITDGHLRLFPGLKVEIKS